MPTQPLGDYSTQAARDDEKRRRKLRRELLKQWKSAHTALDAESITNILAITDEEWQAAKDNDDG